MVDLTVADFSENGEIEHEALSPDMTGEEAVDEAYIENDASEPENESYYANYQAEDFDDEPEPQEENFRTTEIRPYNQKKPVTHVVGQTKVLAAINQKGGVGKTTTAVNLAACLGKMEKQVLLIDFDPQGNATSGLGINRMDVEYCIRDVVLDDVPLEEAIIPDVTEGLDVIPATLNLANAEVELANIPIGRESRLKEKVIGPLRGKYDYIIIDCPPSLGLITVNAFTAADKLLIPIQCEFYALEGVTALLDSMKLVKKYLNPSLDIFGVLLTMYDGRTTLSKQVVEEVRNYFGKVVFETIIPRTVKLSEAPSFGEPICYYDPTGKGALAYDSLAKEVISRG